MRLPAKVQGWLRHPITQHPVVRKVTGYSAGSVIALLASEGAFFATYYFRGNKGTTVASAVGFVGGAVPNYILNRRWAWKDRRGRDRRSEVVLYMLVSLATFVVSALVTHVAQGAAKHITSDRAESAALTTGAFFLVSALFFVVKFFIYEVFVFRPHREDGSDLRGTAP